MNLFFKLNIWEIVKRWFCLQTMALTGVGGVLFVTAGALMIESWVEYKLLMLTDLTLGAGILGVILGAIYLADTGYSFKFA